MVNCEFLALAGLRNRLRDTDQRGLLCVALLCEQGMPKALGFQDASNSINLLSGITRR